MWATVAVTLLAAVTGASAYNVDVQVPAEPALGATVELECNYQLDSNEYIQEMSWRKNGREFLNYRQRPEEYIWRNIVGLNIDRDASNSSRIILNDVQDSASGTYGVRMTIVSQQGGSRTVNTFSHDQDMLVGGVAADTLGNRFGGSSNRRPASSATTTFTSSSVSSSSSSSSGGAPPLIVGTLGNRFGGGSAAAGGPPLVAAAPPPAAGAAVVGIQQAQQQLQNAVNRLQNELNAANAAVNG